MRLQKPLLFYSFRRCLFTSLQEYHLKSDLMMKDVLKYFEQMGELHDIKDYDVLYQVQ